MSTATAATSSGKRFFIAEDARPSLDSGPSKSTRLVEFGVLLQRILLQGIRVGELEVHPNLVMCFLISSSPLSVPRRHLQNAVLPLS